MAEKEPFVYGFSQILVDNNSISEKRAHELERMFKDSGRDQFIYFIEEEGLIDKADLLKALGNYYNVEWFDVDGYFFENSLLRKFPKEFLLRKHIIPLRVDENMLIVVAGNPDDSELSVLINRYVSYDILFMVGIKHDIVDMVADFYDTSLTEGYGEQEESDEIADDIREILSDESDE